MNLASDHGPKTGVAIFASGAGTNAENCMRYFRDHPDICISLIITNNPSAGVIEKAKKYDVPVCVFLKPDWQKPAVIVETLQQYHTGFIVLAGFLRLLPGAVIHAYAGKVINIHPALLPGHGGKGMFGRHVHDSVLTSGDKETGFTIHEVDEVYDRGKIIYQKKIPIDANDTVDTIEKKVRKLEYAYLPRVIETLVMRLRAR